MDGQPPRGLDVRGAVKDLVEAVIDSSKALASATTRFAVDSLQAVDAARSRSEQSAELSAEMASRAEQAAEEARSASAAIEASLQEAREQIRHEARLAGEHIAGQTAYLNDLGARVNAELQKRIDEMVARIEAGAAGQQQAAEAARGAKAASEAAVQHIAEAMSAVDSAVGDAQQAAVDARAAAQEAQSALGPAGEAVTAAREAAEASRRSATLAESAGGTQGDFAAEAGALLERLESDYTLLVRLVQELHVRISGLSLPAAAPAEPVAGPPALEAQAALEPEPAITLAGEPEVDMAAQSFDYEQPEATPRPVEAFGPDERAGPTWSQDALIAALPQGVDAPDAMPEAAPKGLEPGPPAEATYSEPPALTDLPPVEPTITIFGRVQVMISPVADFDRLLTLDSALARVEGVKAVALADYAREEVVFRIELEKPYTVAAFAEGLGEAVSLPASVVEASESVVSLRVG